MDNVLYPFLKQRNSRLSVGIEGVCPPYTLSCSIGIGNRPQTDTTMKPILYVLLFLPTYLAFDWYVYSRYAHFPKRVSPGLYAGGLVTVRC